MSVAPRNNDLNTASKAIKDLYEDKLYHKKGKPPWKNWIDSSGMVSKSRPERNMHVLFSEDSRKTTKNGSSSSRVVIAEKVRELRCLECYGIDCAGLMEKTEDALDALRDCSHACKTSFLNTLPYCRKKKYNFGEEKDFNPRSCIDYLHKGGAEETSNSDAKHSSSGSELPIHSWSLSNRQVTRLPSHSKSNLNYSNASNIANNGLIRPKAAPFSDNVFTVESSNNHSIANPLALNRQAFLDPDLLIYSRHRSLIAAGKMKQQVGKKPVRVHLLNGDSILLVFDPKVLAKEVFEQICSLHSIKEGHFFGLSAIVDNEHRFMDLKLKLSKYAPKEWGKEAKRRASDLSVQPSSVFTVQFQVQYYVEHPKLISNHQSRYHYYLQLKRNVLQSKVAVQDEVIFTLAAAALHIDKGAFDPEVHRGRYFDPHDYVPGWFLSKWGDNYLWSHLPTMHQELASTSTFATLSDYIKQASSIDDVPVHYHRLFKNKGESKPTVIIGIFNRGIRIHHVTSQGLEGPHLLDFEFPWSKVGRLFFAGKRFEIYPEDLPSSRKLVYYTGSRSRSKYLLRLLRDTHSLYMSLSPFVDHMREVDGKKDRKRFRESYISGMNLDEKIKDSVDERLVGSIYNMPGAGKLAEVNTNNHIAVGRLMTSKSSMSHGSSHTSGVESDGKLRAEDAPEVIDDDPLSDDFDPIELDGPPSGSSTNSKRQRSRALPQSNEVTAVSAKVTSLNEAGNKKTDSASDKATSNCQVPPGGEQEYPDLHREGSHSSAARVLLDTETIPSKVATLKRGSWKKIEPTRYSSADDVVAACGLPQLNRVVSEELLASILHDANLEPTNSAMGEAQCSDLRSKHSVSSGNSSKALSTSEVKGRRSSNQKDAARCIAADKQEPLSDDGSRRRRHSKASKERGHRRHKSAHDADLPQQGRSSSKHFGEPLSQKQSFEDLTGFAPLDRSEKSGDIPSVLTAYPSDQFQYRKRLIPVDLFPPTTTSSTVHTTARNPTVAASSGNPVSSAPVSHRKINGIKHETPQNNHRRSDASGFTSTTHKMSNGYARGAAGFTPLKTSPFTGDCHLTPAGDSFLLSSHAIADTTTTKSRNRSYCKLGFGSHAPVFVENHKEVIV